MATKFSYEKAITEIEAIIHDIENEDLSVDELSDNVKKVALLLKSCKNKLVETKGEVDQLLIDIEKE